jgi:hypothetical protein
MSMSLDGFVADRDGGSSAPYPDLENLRHSEGLADMIEAIGAVVMGRRAHDMGDTDEGYVDYEHQVPIFVVTHRVPKVPAKHDPAKGLTFTFVTRQRPGRRRAGRGSCWRERRPGDRRLWSRPMPGARMQADTTDVVTSRRGT